LDAIKFEKSIDVECFQELFYQLLSPKALQPIDIEMILTQKRGLFNEAALPLSDFSIIQCLPKNLLTYIA
jgi:hypothetical protein